MMGSCAVRLLPRDPEYSQVLWRITSAPRGLRQGIATELRQAWAL